MSLLQWFDAREAAAAGASLAEQLEPKAAATLMAAGGKNAAGALQDFLERAGRTVRTLELNFYKRAKLANSFKWQLLERGVDKPTAEAVTNALVMHLLTHSGGVAAGNPAAASGSDSESHGVDSDHDGSGSAKQLLVRGNACFARGEYVEALNLYERLATLKPRHADALNNIGATLCKLSRFHEAEDYLRRAIKLRPEFPEALFALGVVQHWRGLSPEAEAPLRRALKLKPSYVNARSLLGMVLAFQGRLGDAEIQFGKVLKIAPNNADAMVGMGEVARMSGRFADAESWFARALAINPSMAGACAALALLRKMSVSDGAWLERAVEIADSGIPPTEEAALRFSIGKYHDDIGEFARAFESYRQANDLARSVAEPYRRDAHERFVDDLIRVYTRETILTLPNGGSDSRRPVFVVGMLRSGSTLAEQIIASHPAAKGAGELGFWSNVGRKHEAAIRSGSVDQGLRTKLAEDYLRVLAEQSSDALHIVDKALINADYLGLIHSVFPNARIIHMRRNPIDSCLSCYFQQFSPAFVFSLDLTDLAHYYRQHHRLMAHWHQVLPPGSILEVPYEGLVADQAAWTARMLEFIGLEWDDSCLDFYKNDRGVTTASTWQVRQKIYQGSVGRWRHYEKFIKPLMSLKQLDD
jgi:tetratricopeptide (TPR) repeat protein